MFVVNKINTDISICTETEPREQNETLYISLNTKWNPLTDRIIQKETLYMYIPKYKMKPFYRLD